MSKRQQAAAASKRKAKPKSQKLRRRRLPKDFRPKSPGDTIFELAFIKTHAKTLNLFFEKVITGRTIYRRLCKVLRTNYINPDASPSEYIRSDEDSGSKALRAFTQVLNNSAEFQPDGLHLLPGDFADVENMGQLGGVIVGWYRKNGWQVSVG
ncbi:hypothetical protein [Sinorhizobium prairiense]|uniref:hypothetical protein n=1 Tax=unclassified Sinorhizobium TaxID=2613772 RepID=UPI0023D894E2|nr:MULTISPECIES: hypothetical protein [unclassified Sinorhizobium]WEJ08554.1 hypothetical protein N0Q90_02545 [Sinorhizobium sp. M103]WEJ13943.1 hypothetical protein N0Q91_00180 [Sinorhizobium sp. K101]WEJ35544.1 hypothetical protein N0R80_00170 [Sinorhizobium sp. C101]